ncbi:phosphonate ABC transporter ATP-binding protein [Lacticaseibacillus baoqingensis]|uniref:Phosphonate ABC transporter ATP-binding protein n=1 Tax=Lacticaseibacillus baoqingensis TaxID=2486013 RepID=A0ABW4E6N7_9LACO|nr:phosphonate ABC transporter ATP-binding protein [Lacticaseibacillus baoqingensis]
MLTIAGLNKTYPNHKRGLEAVNVTFAPGVTAIIGPSGAGKTTLLRSINRLITPESGSVRLGDQEIRTANAKALRKIRHRIGMIFQDYNLIEELAAIDNVLHGCLGGKTWLAGILGHYTAAEQARAYELLAEVGLADFATQRCADLSGGQKQRVGIARALMQSPEVILCDEPIASLDPASTQAVMTLLGDLAKRGIMIIVNLHQVDIARQYADHIVGVNQGRIVFDGPTAGLNDAALAAIYAKEAVAEDA